MPDQDAVQIVRRFAPRVKPMAIPSPLVFDAPLVCVQLNERWVGHLLGVMEALDQPDAWLGTPEEIQAARDQINQLMLIFSLGNCPPETGGGIIYDPIDDTFYWYPPGGGEPIEIPQVDPRNIPIVPPKTTGDIKCDSAASLVAWFQTTIDEITFAWGEGATAVGAASLIIAALTGGFIALIILAIDIMGIIFGFGLSVVQGAFTAELYADLLCIFFNNMGDDGQFDEAGKAAMLADIYSDVGGTAFGVLSGMIQLMGLAGLNNQAAAGLETDDCDDCAEPLCIIWDFRTGLHGATLHGGTQTAGQGIVGANFGGSSLSNATVELSFPDVFVVQINVEYTKNGGGGTNNTNRTLLRDMPTFLEDNYTNTLGTNLVKSLLPNATGDNILQDLNSGDDPTPVTIHQIAMYYTGTEITGQGEPC